MGFGGEGILYLGEFGLELAVDLVEGAAEVGELLAGLVGDEGLRHAVPIDRLSRLCGHFRHLLHPVSAHLRPPLSLTQGAAGSPLSPLTPIANGEVEANETAAFL